MPEETKPDFFERVYEVVAKIPYGRVTSYGAIARYTGTGKSARMVGYALNQSIKSSDSELPCHRVVNRLGQLTGKAYFGEGVMESMLRQENISFTDIDTVDIRKHFWDPMIELPVRSKNH
ncbi:MAG: methylated-DNA--[protein]-cysteine S-methyltransferase [Balneolales bacterium]|nr:methylated-DNA--[protein]-cysteine S-methyltransferase [Balneolales bacterium]